MNILAIAVNAILDVCSAAIRPGVQWAASASFGPVANSNFYVLLFIPVAMVIVARQFIPRNALFRERLMWFLLLLVWPALTYVLCVGFILFTSATFAL